MNTNNTIGADVLGVINNHSLSDIMSTDVLTVYEGWSVKRLAGFFIKRDISGAPVVASDDELVGVVTQSDVVRFDSRERTDSEMKNLVRMYCGPHGGELSQADLKHLKDRASETCTVNSIMTPEVISMDITKSVADVCTCFIETGVHRIFVTEDSKLVGVVTAMDVLRSIVKS